MLKLFILLFALLLLSNHLTNANNEGTYLENDTVIYEKWLKLDKMLKTLTNSAVKKALPTLMDLSSKVNISSECTSQGFKLFNGLRKLEQWAVTFVDASGKIIDGLLSSTTASLGDYNQCLDAVAKQKTLNEEKILFQGQYCTAEFKPPLPAMKSEYFKNGIVELQNFTKSASGMIRTLADKAHFFYVASLKVGVCVPSGCSKEDVTQLLRAVSDQVYLSADVQNCAIKKPMSFETGAIVAISIYCILAFTVFTGTLLALHYRNTKNRPQNKALQVVLGFSFQKNFEDFLKPDTSKDNISCLNGIRFLTLTWIVSSHTFFILSRVPELHQHFDEILDATKRFGMQIVVNFLFSVDTFFLLGGLVNCYVTVKDKEKNKSRSFIYSVKHRLWRIVPTYGTVMLSSHLVILVAAGPADHFPLLQSVWHSCQYYWWRNLLFINNFYGIDESCIPQTWYLSADFQLFIIAFVTIRILIRYPKFGLILNTGMVLFSALFNVAWTQLHGMHASFVVTDVGPYQFERLWRWYTQTMAHAGPYFVGVIAGYLLAVKKDLKFSKMILFFGWCLSVFMATSIIFCTWKWYNNEGPTKVEDIFYAALSKICFAVAVAWTIVCCAKGYGGLINQILSWRIWTPLSKIALPMYLISPIVQMITVASVKTLREPTAKEWVWRFFGDYFVSAFLAFLIYAMVENPFVNFEKIFSSSKKENPVQNGAESTMSAGEKACKLETITANGNGFNNSMQIS